MVLDLHLADELRNLHEEMEAAGDLPSREQLARYYATFRNRFGPERLQAIDGEPLLEMMHAHGNRDSLVYWLEFKNDEEFPGIFGSIAGGSALKFGVYKRKETEAWVTGSPQRQREISVSEAIAIARKHREQLVSGTELLAQLPPNATDEVYRDLQDQMNHLAPDVSNTAWGHKYFSLLYHDKLDDYHVEHFQRFHLVKLLQTPPGGSGRYLAAGRYVAIAGELDMPLNHLTTVLNRRNGRPYRYWRIATKPDGTTNDWEQMHADGYVGIGWAEIGDLSHISYTAEGKQEIREAISIHWPDKAAVAGIAGKQVFDFVAGIREGDLVLAANGKVIQGIGRVLGDYVYNRESKAAHRRNVEWVWSGEWQLPASECPPRMTVCEIRKEVNNLVAIEQQLLKTKVAQPESPPPTTIQLTGIAGRIHAVLERKRQVILYGPPGTGKTFWAREAAQQLAAQHYYRRSFADLEEAERRFIYDGDGQIGPLVRLCTFHPAYGYEDFLEGYRPHAVNDQMLFELRDGIFKKVCADAARHPGTNFYLIIDEINRGDIPRIFGELLTILEMDKRGETIWLPLSRHAFAVPKNVFVIGTMNTADRSIALLDIALRRRFGFIELMPDYSLFGDTVLENSIPLGPWLEALNERLLEFLGRDARNLQIGHAYFLENGRPVKELGRFATIIQEDILPLLEEYCYEDYESLARILGNNLVDEKRQRIRRELFASERRDDLIQALLAPAPDLMTSARAVSSTVKTEVSDEDAEEVEAGEMEANAL